jgi:hypothetical protein
MWNDSHADESWVDCLKRYLRIWKKESGGYSDATICDEIVKAHDAIGGPAKTGIRFQPGSVDEYNRKKANAARIMRMLNDELDGDDGSLLNINFLPSVLAAMPAALRIRFLNEYLGPVDLRVCRLDDRISERVTIGNLTAMMKEDSESVAACAQLLEDADEEALAVARKETHDALEEKIKMLRAIDSMIISKGRVHSIGSADPQLKPQ